ncbi:hypothetical protein DPMN_074974 [Dreissena polymorpha]|uniref:Uncharacterized protein n=1 Tax=Dreissena polymorpha TaxID=45954 RepID=A0A9D3YH92_DREPO|nr:hypothetical protein DPMN_074974 [Dreissena polymorpha]
MDELDTRPAVKELSKAIDSLSCGKPQEETTPHLGQSNTEQKTTIHKPLPNFLLSVL